MSLRSAIWFGGRYIDLDLKKILFYFVKLQNILVNKTF